MTYDLIIYHMNDVLLENSNTQAKPGVNELLKFIQAKGIKQGLLAKDHILTGRLYEVGIDSDLIDCLVLLRGEHTYPYQEPTLVELDEWIGEKDWQIIIVGSHPHHEMASACLDMDFVALVDNTTQAEAFGSQRQFFPVVYNISELKEILSEAIVQNYRICDKKWK